MFHHVTVISLENKAWRANGALVTCAINEWTIDEWHHKRRTRHDEGQPCNEASTAEVPCVMGKNTIAVVDSVWRSILRRCDDRVIQWSRHLVNKNFLPRQLSAPIFTDESQSVIRRRFSCPRSSVDCTFYYPVTIKFIVIPSMIYDCFVPAAVKISRAGHH